MPTLTRAKRYQTVLGGLFLFAGFASASLASTIEPAQPAPFQRVNLRMTVDGCVFNPHSIRVTADNNTIRVHQQPNNCFVPGPIQIVDIQLGAFPIGAYQVAVYMSLGDSEPIERLSFSVFGLLEPTIEPPIPHPLTDYTGLWWTPTEGGTGLLLQQGPLFTLFGVWAIYDTDHQPLWFSLQGGQWTSSTSWTGSVVASSGPEWSTGNYDASTVRGEVVGTATLNFLGAAASEGKTMFTYKIGATTATKAIVRLGL
jgi:hypothetical protein